jgi:hypothetical protein
MRKGKQSAAAAGGWGFAVKQRQQQQQQQQQRWCHASCCRRATQLRRVCVNLYVYQRCTAGSSR